MRKMAMVLMTVAACGFATNDAPTAQNEQEQVTLSVLNSDGTAVESQLAGCGGSRRRRADEPTTANADKGDEAQLAACGGRRRRADEPTTAKADKGDEAQLAACGGSRRRRADDATTANADKGDEAQLAACGGSRRRRADDGLNSQLADCSGGKCSHGQRSFQTV